MQIKITHQSLKPSAYGSIAELSPDSYHPGQKGSPTLGFWDYSEFLGCQRASLQFGDLKLQKKKIVIFSHIKLSLPVENAEKNRGVNEVSLKDHGNI